MSTGKRGMAVEIDYLRGQIATLRARLAAEKSALLTAKGDLAEAGHRLASLEAAGEAVLEQIGYGRKVHRGRGEEVVHEVNGIAVQALRAALAPRSERRDGESDDGSMICSCGRVTLDWFTSTHSMLTKEGEQFISTNHRRDRCDREEVIPDPVREQGDK